MLLVYGSADARVAGDCAAFPNARPVDAGHAVLDEAPDATAAVVGGFLNRGGGGVSFLSEASEPSVVAAAARTVVATAVVEDFDAPLARPPSNAWPGAPKIAAGATRGAWIALRAAGGRAGVGEAAPCAGVHAETAEDARAALRACARKLEGATLPENAGGGALGRFLDATCGADAMMPSVRFALETAVAMLVEASPAAAYRGGALKSSPFSSRRPRAIRGAVATAGDPAPTTPRPRAIRRRRRRRDRGRSGTAAPIVQRRKQ